MSPLQQVVHVLRKDLTRLRWFVATYVLLCALAVARVAGWAEIFGSTPMVLSWLAILVVVLAIQDDAPLHDNVAWRAQPFTPASMLAAKLLLMAILFTVGLSGQLICAWMFRADAMLIGQLFWQSSGILLFLVGAALLAAPTSNIRTFLLTLIGVPLVAIAALILLPRDLPGSAPTLHPMLLWSGWRWVVLGSGIALFSTWYLRRVSTRMAWAGVILVALAGAAQTLLSAIANNAPTQTQALNVAPPRQFLLVYGIDFDDDSSAILSVAADGAVHTNADLVMAASGVATLTFPDGNTRRVDLNTSQRGLETTETGPDGVTSVSGSSFGGNQPGSSLVLVEPGELDSARLRWPRWRVVRALYSVGLMNDVERAAIEAGRVSVATEGVAVVYASRVSVSVPLWPGTRTAKNGVRVRPEILRSIPGRPVRPSRAPLWRVDILAAATPGDAVSFQLPFGAAPPGVVLIDRAANTVVSTLRNDDGMETNGLVLPGPHWRTRVFANREMATPPTRAPRRSDTRQIAKRPLELAVVAWTRGSQMRFTAAPAIAKKRTVLRLNRSSSMVEMQVR